MAQIIEVSPNADGKIEIQLFGQIYEIRIKEPKAKKAKKVEQ